MAVRPPHGSLRFPPQRAPLGVVPSPGPVTRGRGESDLLDAPRVPCRGHGHKIYVDMIQIQRYRYRDTERHIRCNGRLLLTTLVFVGCVSNGARIHKCIPTSCRSVRRARRITRHRRPSSPATRTGTPPSGSARSFLRRARARTVECRPFSLESRLRVSSRGI
jgi:hypothetical protein